MKPLESKPAPGTGTIYSGRCAGGNFKDTQILMIAPDDAALARAWEALQLVDLDRSMVYDVSVISTKKLSALIAPKSEAPPEPMPLDVD